MSNPVLTIENGSWLDGAGPPVDAVSALESGRVLYVPELAFPLEEHEKAFLANGRLELGSKNVSYDPISGDVRGLKSGGAAQADRVAIARMLARYAEFTRDLCAGLLGDYADRLTTARTSFRPVEVETRRSRTVGSDDTLLHVDSFSSRPVAGRRILRIFTNVSPVGRPRVWNVGEPFEALARRFLPTLRLPLPGERALLRALNVTRSYRTLYDHYMLRLHDDMKADAHYQRTVPHTRVELAAGSTWMCFTDQVSHAALSGQHVLEQSMYCAVEDMARPERSPLRILESIARRSLV